MRSRKSSPFFWIIWTGFSIFWVVLVACFTITAYVQNRTEYELLTKEGLWTKGQVVDRRVEISDDDDDGTTTTYYVTYEFFVPESGERIEIDDAVSLDIYNHVEKGGRVELIYAKSDPEIARLKAEFVAPTKFDLMIVVCFPMFGLPFVLLGLWMLRQEIDF
jgi:hypothetical protein